MKLVDVKQFNLPDAPGVYYFLSEKGEILYVGKATSLKDRVKSYFMKDILLTRGPKIVKMLEDAVSVTYQETPSVLEALILEANEIKKHQPPANSRDKDDKSYNYVVVTKEDFPRILIVRGTNLKAVSYKPEATFGPFPHASELREALKIVRKIFPYRDEKCKIVPGKSKPCFNAQIGLCPGPCAGWISKRDYRKIVKHISLFFQGKKDTLIKDLEKEMKQLAKEQKFEEAEEVKRQIFALDHIQDVALIKADMATRNFDGLTLSSGAPTPIEISGRPFRIEAYDIAHLSGKNAVGVMTVVEDGELNKSQYRKFKIKVDNPTSRKATSGQGNDDVGNLKQVLERRLSHPEWTMPDLIVVDGGVGQLNAARSLTTIPVVAVTKDKHHKAREIVGLEDKQYEKAIILVNSEAHRFAIGYHRKLRNKGFRI